MYFLFNVISTVNTLAIQSSSLTAAQSTNYASVSPHINNVSVEESYTDIDLLNEAADAGSKRRVENPFFEEADFMESVATEEKIYSNQNIQRLWSRDLNIPTSSLNSTSIAIDFQQINSIFEGTIFNLPDALNLEGGSFLGNELYFDLTNIVCENLALENVVVTPVQKNNQQMDLELQVNGIEFDCSLDIAYRQYGWFGSSSSGQGAASATSESTKLETSLILMSDDFSYYPPTNFSLGPCETDVQIETFNLSGNNIFFDIANVFKELFIDEISSGIGDILCSELSAAIDSLNDTLEFPNMTDPLSPQNDLFVTPGVTLFDLRNLNSTSNIIIGIAMSELKSLTSDIVEDPNGIKASGEDLGINVQLRSLLLDDERTLTIEIDDFSFAVNGVSALVNKIRLTSLDTFKSIDLLNIIAPQTFSNQFNLEKLDIEVDMKMDFGYGNVTEMMTINIGFKDLNMSLGILLAIDQDIFGDHELGSLLSFNNFLPCLLSSLYQFEISQLISSVKDISVSTMDSNVSQETKSIISSFDKLSKWMINSTPAIFDSIVGYFLNLVASTYIANDSNKICPQASLTSRSFLNFGDLLLSEKEAVRLNALGNGPYGDVVRYLKNRIDDTILTKDDVTGTSSINEIIVNLTKSQSNISGSLIASGDIFGTETDLSVGGLKGLFEFKIFNARIENLDTIVLPSSFFNPIEPHILNNTATFGVDSRDLLGAVSLLIAFEDDDHSLRNEFDLSLGIKSTQIILAALLKISERPFLKYPLRDIFNIQCWLSTVPAPKLDPRGVRFSDSELNAALKNLQIIFSDIRLSMNCISCSSPKMQVLASHLSSSEAVVSVTDALNNIFEIVVSLLGGDFLQTEIDRALYEAPMKCPHNSRYNQSLSSVQYLPFSAPKKSSESVDFLLIIAAVYSGLICFAIILKLSVDKIGKNSHARWLQTLSTDELVETLKQQSMDRERDDRLDDASSCMINSTSIPLIIRYSMPIVLLGNVGLFLSGHLSLGASVNINANIAGEIVYVDNFFEFSMAKSTVDMWNAGAKGIAVFIVIVSGAWPYIKQFTTLFLWIAPPKWVSVSRRGYIFLWLDKLAKWSFVDIFVLLMSIAAFNITVNSPANVAFLIPNLYSLRLMVVPLWGMYANMTAQLLSQISSHFIIHYHRRIIADTLGEAHGGDRLFIESLDDMEDDANIDNGKNKKKISEVTGKKEKQHQYSALFNHRYDRDSVEEGNSLYVRNYVNYVLATLAMISVSFIIWGCTSKSFSLEVLGIVGLLVESGQDFNDSILTYSVFDIVNLLSDQSKRRGKANETVGMGVLSSVLILSVFIVPIIQIALLLCRWFIPLSRKSRVFSFVFLEILNAWQYIEVYILSVVVTAWQLGSVSEFLINNFCDSFEGTFASLAYYNIISDDDAQCFRVNARVETGLWVLLTGAIIISLINRFVSNAASQQEKDEIAIAKALMAKPDPQSANFNNNSNINDLSELDCQNAKNRDELISLIKPVPNLFTVHYCWFLSKRASPSSIELVVDIGGPSESKISLSK